MTKSTPPSPYPPHGLFPAGEVASFHGNDFDEVASIPPLWEQKYSQIGRGKFEGKLFMALTSKLGIGFEQFSVGLMSRGAFPPDCAIIFIPFRCGGMSTYRGEQLTDRSAVIAFSGEELDFRSTVGFDVLTLFAERNLLEQHAQRILGRPLASLRRNSQALICEPDQTHRRLRAKIERLAARQEHLGPELCDPVAAADFEHDMCDAVLGSLAPRPAHRHNLERAELAWTVEEYLRAHLGEEISIQDLCRLTGASERMVHLAFRRHIGSAPKAYQKMLLLNAVRRDLRVAPPGTTVTEVAVRWGLLHFGWFAHDYKTLFGQSPLDTLHDRPPAGAQFPK